LRVQATNSASSFEVATDATGVDDLIALVDLALAQLPVEIRRLQVTTAAGLGFPTPPGRSASPAGSGPSGPSAAGGGTP
jgi:hypothetical protein